jgi:hypothetical protein
MDKMRLLRRFEGFLRNRKKWLGDPVPGWEGFEACYDGYGPREGCVREGGIFWHDEVNQGIVCMFHAYWQFVVLTAGKARLESFLYDIVVEPSYEDNTAMLVVDKGIVLASDDGKAWNFQWDTPEKMAEVMLERMMFLRMRMKVAQGTRLAVVACQALVRPGGDRKVAWDTARKAAKFLKAGERKGSG